MSRESARYVGAPPKSHESRGATRRALVERLSRMAPAPAEAERIVEAACSAESISTVPPVGEGLAAFIDGPLRAETARVLGPDAAATFVDQIVSMIRARPDAVPETMYLRITRRPSNPAYGTSPAVTPVAPVTAEALFAATDELGTLGPIAMPMGVVASFDDLEYVRSPRGARVLVASHDTARVTAIATAMGPDVDVRHVDDVLELFESLSTSRNDMIFLVIDSRFAAVSPSTVVANLADLPPSTEIVLWGDENSEGRDATNLAAARKKWTTLDAETTPRELAVYLRHSANRRANGASLPARR